MMKITITSMRVDSSFVEEHPEFEVGDTAYYVIRDSGTRISVYYQTEIGAAAGAWNLIKKYGLTLVEPW